MAKMYGVEIKSMRTFIGHEGECAQGNVYYNGKLLGFWSQDAWGGPDRFDFDEHLIDEAVEKYKLFLPKDNILFQFVDAACLLDEIVQLSYMEKKFKKYTAKGYHTVVKVDNGMGYSLGAFNYTNDRDINKYVNNLIGKMKNPKITFYKSLNDFIIE